MQRSRTQSKYLHRVGQLNYKSLSKIDINKINVKQQDTICC